MPRESADANSKPIEIRPGNQFPPWGGIYRRGDPSQVPPNRFHSLVNVRLNQGDIESRPGMSHVAGTPEDACITGMIELDSDPNSVCMFIDDTELHPGGATPKGTLVTRFNDEDTPQFRSYWAGPSGVDNEIIKKKLIDVPGQISGFVTGYAVKTIQLFRGRLLALAIQNSVGKVWNCAFSVNDDGTTAVDLSVAFDPKESANGEVVDMCVRLENTPAGHNQEVLYLATSAGKVLRWDDTQLTVESGPAGVSPAFVRICCVGGTALFLASPATPQQCKYQLVPGGVWTGVSFNVAHTMDTITCLTEFQGQCLIFGHHGINDFFVGGWNPSSPSTIGVLWNGEPGGPGANATVIGARVIANELYILIDEGSGV